jgi:LCP family protein required for cell wall assembly
MLDSRATVPAVNRPIQVLARDGNKPQSTSSVTQTPPPAVPRLPLPRYEPPEHPSRVVRRRFRLRRRLLQTAGVVAGVMLVGTGLFSWRAYVQLHKVFHGTTTVAALSAKPVTPDLLKGEGDGRVNILLLGVGGAGHEGADLTDTIVVFSVDPVNHTAAFLSVPRDLWVKMPVNYFGQYQKINAAYESGKYRYLGQVDASNANAAAVEAGFSSVDQAVEGVLGITINYHVLVNFQAFRQAVDTVGGVSVDVKDQLYDPTMAWENGGNPVLAPAGVQAMNGKQALLYARSRETSSDFARTDRQRQLLVALKDKVLTAGTLSNPAKIDGLMNTFGDNVYSDLSLPNAQRLYSITKNIDDSQIASVDLSKPPQSLVTTDHVGNISVVRPRAGFNEYGLIQTFVRTQLPDGYLTKEHASVTVLAPTAAGAAATAATLKTYGYNVTASQAEPTAVKLRAPMLVDLSHGKAPYTRNYLQRHYDTTAVQKLPAGVALPTGSAKFVIIVSK